MKFVARAFRYLFWLIVVSGIVALLRRLVGQMGNAVPGSRPEADVTNNGVSKKLVRDPICGMHIAEGLALPVKHGSEIFYFCSAECRDRYTSQTQEFAASA